MKILEGLIIISIILITIYIFDKSTSNDSNDAANIIIGISDRDSESCLQCKEGGEFYDRGCKICEQDNINFRIKNTENTPFISSWSKDSGMFYGDSQCKGEKIIPSINAEINKEYWTEIKYIDSKYTISIYDDKNFEKKQSTITNEMCSTPINLKFLRFSMNDGKPISNGGRLTGNIDNIQIFDYNNSKNNLNEFENKLHNVYNEDFTKCKTKDCNEWVLQNKDVFFIDTDEKKFHFDSYISGNNDYAHYELSEPLSEKEWMIRLVLSFDHIDEFPHGKGILGISPLERNLVFIFTSVVFVMIGRIFSIKHESLNINILIIIFSTILLYVSLTPLIYNDLIFQNESMEKIGIIVSLIILSLILISFSISRIYSRMKNNS